MTHPLEIIDGLFFIQRGYLNGNHFVYRSREPVLIDTGYLTHFEATERTIRELGVNPAQVKQIINTHTHCDHMGGNRIIQGQSGCGIALHHIGKHLVEKHDDWATWYRYFNQEAEFFECTHGLEDGEAISIGPHVFEVLYTPGHASDQIVLYNEENQVLLSSDALWERDIAVLNIRVEGSTAPFRWLESLERLQGLQVKEVYPGHGPPFEDFEGALARSRKRLQSYLEHAPRIGADLLKKIFVYTLLMKPGLPEASFMDYLMSTHWFPETVDLYFEKGYNLLYRETLGLLLERDIVIQDQGRLYAQVPA